MVLLGVLLERAVIETLSLVGRDVVDDQTQNTLHILTILSLVFASISVVSTLSTLYWFMKMRKSFRHELIMLLIQSDFVKSAAFVVFPIVNLIRGTVDSDSAFCQASGFGLTVGVESSDIAVLLIALHSVMYIFRPRSGLYPYRRAAYLIYYLFPVVTASLAFINGPGYENLGHYCYLRTDRGWRRMALSWIPRYIIGTAIVVIYFFIYIYIRRRMDDYGRRSSGSFEQGRNRSHVPPLPRITYHGLLPSSPNSRRPSAADSAVAIKSCHRSLSSASSLGVQKQQASASPSRKQALLSPDPTIDWNWSGFRQPRSSVENPFPDETEDPLSLNPNPAIITRPQHVYPAPANPSRPGTDHHSDSSSIGVPPTFWRRPVTLGGNPSPTTGADRAPLRQPNVSLPNIVTMLRRGPPPPTLTIPPPPVPRTHTQIQSQGHTSDRRTHHHISAATATTTTSPSMSSPPIPTSLFDDAPGLARANRDKIRRQLRALFAYPLVYMCVWVFPFVSHVMGYDDAVRSGDPPWLLVLGIISLSVQGAVDCALFAVRERPWRHAARARLGFWEGLASQFREVGFTADRGMSGQAGRTREEMIVDGQLARERRDGEIVVEQALRTSAAAAVMQASSADKGVRRGLSHGQAAGQSAGLGMGMGGYGAYGYGYGYVRKEAREWWDVEGAGWAWGEDEDEEHLVVEETGTVSITQHAETGPSA